jgi:hypothetical protein
MRISAIASGGDRPDARNRTANDSNQTTLEITSTHAKAGLIADALSKVSAFLKRIRSTAEMKNRFWQMAAPARILKLKRLVTRLERIGSMGQSAPRQ